jgi:hypothetical protein
MSNYKKNTIAASGTYQIIYCESEEYGMGGPYAAAIYLQAEDKAPFFINSKCFGEAVFAEDESCFFFLHLNSDRKLQVMQYEITTCTLQLFKDIYDYAAFETVGKHACTVNGKIWDAVNNKYQEGLVICDTNAENVETSTVIAPKIIIEPKDGIQIVTFYDNRKTVNERLKNSITYPDRKIDFYTKHGFHVHYNDKDMVEFIEIMSDMELAFELYEKNPFATAPEEICKLLSEKNNGEENLIEAPVSFMYLELSLGIFRNSTPEKYAKYIEQAKIDEPESFKNGMPEWMLDELEKTKHFQTIGLGNKGYFRNPVYFIKEG